MDREIIKHWVTLLEFKADREQARDLIFNVNSIGSALVAVASAMEAASIALAAAVIKTAEGLTKLGEAAERSSVSAEQLQAFGYAAKQMGVDVDSAKGALQHFSDWLEKQQGVQTLRRYGINPYEADNKTIRDRMQLLREFAEVMNNQHPAVRMRLFAEAGFGSAELRDLLTHPEEFAKFYKEELDRLHELDINLRKATEDSKELTQEQNRLKQVISDIWTAVESKVSPRLTSVIREIREAVEEHAPQIKAMLVWASEGLVDYFIKPTWEFLKWWHKQGNTNILPQLGDQTGNWWDIVSAKMKEFRDGLARLGPWIVDYFVGPVKRAVDALNQSITDYFANRPKQVYPGGTSSGGGGAGGGGGADTPAAPVAPSPPAKLGITESIKKHGLVEGTKRWWRGDTEPTPPTAVPAPTGFKGGPAGGSGGPGHVFGELDIEGEKYRFGSGSGQHAPIPPGTYPITPNEIGPWGQAHGAIGINHNAIYDASLGRNRGGIEIHAGSSDALITAGCIAIAGRDYPRFKAHVKSMIATHGSVFLSVGRDGRASVTPAGLIGKLKSAVKNATPALQEGKAKMSGAESVSKLLDVRDRASPNSTPAHNFSSNNSVNVNVSGGKEETATKNTEMSGPRDQSRMQKNLQGSIQ